MCTKFQVNILEKDVFIAFETSKVATFQDIPMHYKVIVFRFYALFYTPNAVLGSFFELRTIQEPIVRLNDTNHKIDLG